MKTITVHLTDKAFEALESASYAEAISCTDVISRALITYSTLSATRRSGEKVTLHNADGSPWRVVAVIAAGGAS